MKYDTVNKELVRKIDLDYISRIAMKKKVGYFGMPGPNVLDIKSWKNKIEFVHSVERDQKNALELNLNLIDLNFKKNKMIFKNDLYQVITNPKNKDIFAKYQLINLDFTGVMVSSISKTQGNKKLDAIELIIRNQAEKFKDMEEMIFLVTFYGARNEDKELDVAIDELFNNFNAFVGLENSNISEIQEWVINLGKQYHKMLIVFPVWFFPKCSNFNAEFKELIYYLGDSNSPMVHFIIKLTRIKAALDLTPYINIQKIQSIPLQKIKKITDGKVVETNLGIPEFRIIRSS